MQNGGADAGQGQAALAQVRISIPWSKKRP